MTFQLPDGMHAGSPSVPVNYAVCSRVFKNSDPHGSRDRWRRGRVALYLSPCTTPYHEDPSSAMAGRECF